MSEPLLVDSKMAEQPTAPLESIPTTSLLDDGNDCSGPSTTTCTAPATGREETMSASDDEEEEEEDGVRRELREAGVELDITNLQGEGNASLTLLSEVSSVCVCVCVCVCSVLMWVCMWVGVCSVYVS